MYIREKGKRRSWSEREKEKVEGHRERGGLIYKTAALHILQNTMYPLNFTGEW